MSALFSHAVRWEFCSHNPISSGVPDGSGAKRAPSTGVRISSKRQHSPLVLSPEQVKLGPAKLEFRGPVARLRRWFLGNSPGRIGGAAVAGSRFREPELQRRAFLLLAARWKPEEYKNRSIGQAVAHASQLERCVGEVEITQSLQPPTGLRISVGKTQGRQAAGFGFRVEEENPVSVRVRWHHRSWHRFRHIVGTMLPEMGKHQLTIRDYLRAAIYMSPTSICSRHRRRNGRLRRS